jgi:hypothetical protein
LPDPGLAFAPVPSYGPVPPTVWSWTTEEQATEIRRDKILFTRESSATLGRGYLFDILELRAAKGDAAAARLVGAELAKGRFGWGNPWATARGATANETYGRELLKIEMRPDTWYARVRTAYPEILFVDAAGNLIDNEIALASFDRVGGILFDHDKELAGACSTGWGGGGLAYREIYVGNESRVATFSHRTSDILETLDANIAELEAFGGWLKSAQPTLFQWPCDASNEWSTESANTSLERYLASLAFATGQYRPTSDNIDAIVAALRAARFAPDPFTHSP